MKLEKTCIICNSVHEINVTAQQYSDWQNGALAQKVFTNLSSDERELLISGVCGKCFDCFFEDDDDDNDNDCNDYFDF